MTATPRIYSDTVKDKAEQYSAELVSMDDEYRYGPEFHHLSFGDAVERGLLSDYKVLVLTVDESLMAASLQQETDMAGKLFIMCTHGPSDPERATVAFVMATSAQASDVEVVVGLQIDGVLLAGKGGVGRVEDIDTIGIRAGERDGVKHQRVELADPEAGGIGDAAGASRGPAINTRGHLVADTITPGSLVHDKLVTEAVAVEVAVGLQFPRVLIDEATAEAGQQRAAKGQEAEQVASQPRLPLGQSRRAPSHRHSRRGPAAPRKRRANVRANAGDCSGG